MFFLLNKCICKKKKKKQRELQREDRLSSSYPPERQQKLQATTWTSLKKQNINLQHLLLKVYRGSSHDRVQEESQYKKCKGTSKEKTREQSKFVLLIGWTTKTISYNQKKQNRNLQYLIQ